jgi:hypothetical protein
MRIMALAEFFFPSSRYKKVKRSSRTRTSAINITKNQGANIYPCVWMSASSGSSAAAMSCHCHAHNHHDRMANMHGRMSVDVEEEVPWYPSMSVNRPDSPIYYAEYEQDHFIPAALPRQARAPARNPVSGHRNNARRAAERPENNHGNGRYSHDHGRFSAYANATLQAQTCFLGTNPMNGDDPNFYDQTIRFRVIDRTGYQQGDGPAGTEREMMVVSSPANMQAVLETLAPQGSGRRIVVRAKGKEGEEEFLAFTVLPQGWPFDILLEEG